MQKNHRKTVQKKRRGLSYEMFHFLSARVNVRSSQKARLDLFQSGLNQISLRKQRRTCESEMLRLHPCRSVEDVFLSPQQPTEYFDMGIFLAFFVVVSLVCLILLIKIKLKQRRSQVSANARAPPKNREKGFISAREEINS